MEEQAVTITAEDAKEIKAGLNILEQAVEDAAPEPESKFEWAYEVEQMANQLISTVEQFDHLAEARIAYLYRKTKLTSDWMTKDRVVMGKAFVNDERQQFLSGYDLQVVINRRVWEIADREQREALLAHELCHFEAKEPDKHGNPRWGLAHHDVEEFAYVVRRYGIWDESLRRFMAAKEEGEVERQQGNLFNDEGEES